MLLKSILCSKVRLLDGDWITQLLLLSVDDPLEKLICFAEQGLVERGLYVGVLLGGLSPSLAPSFSFAF